MPFPERKSHRCSTTLHGTRKKDRKINSHILFGLRRRCPLLLFDNHLLELPTPPRPPPLETAAPLRPGAPQDALPTCQCMLRVLVGTNHRPRTICRQNKRGERSWRSPRCMSDLCRCSLRPQVLSSLTSSVFAYPFASLQPAIACQQRSRPLSLNESSRTTESKCHTTSQHRPESWRRAKR